MAAVGWIFWLGLATAVFSHGRAGKSLKVRMVFDMGESWMDGRILKLVSFFLFFFFWGGVVAVVTLPWSPRFFFGEYVDGSRRLALGRCMI